MAISEKYKGRYIFHFTDMENLDSIIKNGLLCTNVKNERGIVHKNIANMTIQERRANMDVPVGPGGKVHDYVPFYFSSINPMLLKKLNEKNVDQPLIIYLCVKIERLDKEDAVFTDASANTNIPPTFYDDPANLDKLNWDLIDSRKWGVATTEDKHMKMAEAMIHNRIGIDEIDAIVVYNDYAKKQTERIFKENGIPVPTLLYDNDAQIKRYRFYYTKFFLIDRKRETLVFLDTIPMLARILTEEIETLSEEEIRLVCMLVVYHDIVGDCMVKGGL